jgi:hypothetical protein
LISLQDYWMGRDKKYPDAWSEAIEGAAAELLSRVDALLTDFGEERKITSGWRPPEVNSKTPNAALKSKHMTGHAIDLADPDGDLDDWCSENDGERLKAYNLWMEHPAATKGWCHLQSLPPKSGRRVFYP